MFPISAIISSESYGKASIVFLALGASFMFLILFNTRRETLASSSKRNELDGDFETIPSGMVTCLSTSEHNNEFIAVYIDTHSGLCSTNKSAALSKDATVLCCDLNVHALSPARTIIYSAFDQICEQNGMARVEAGLNNYIAVAGLQSVEQTAIDHAVAMVQFIIACQEKVHELFAKGMIDGNTVTAPKMRYSIHSGSTSEFSVTNVALLLEKTGSWGQCHVSRATANRLKKAGMGNWVQRRNDGYLVGATYWLLTEPCKWSSAVTRKLQENAYVFIYS